MYLNILIIMFAFQSSHFPQAHGFTEQSFTVKHNEANQSNGPILATKPHRRLKILISNPSLGWSHSQFLGALADALIDAGHEVHMITFTLNTDFDNNYVGSTRVRTLITHVRPVKNRDLLFNKLSFNNDLFNGLHKNIIFAQLKEFNKLGACICKELLSNKPLLDHLREQQFDFGIAEPFLPCIFGIFKVVNVKSMAISQAVALSSAITSIFGIPTFSSFIYDVWSISTKDPLKMQFLERMNNFISDVFMYWHRDTSSNILQPLFNTALGPEAPILRDIMRNVSLAFINTKDLLSMPRPISQKIVYVGGITDKEQVETKFTIPQEIRKIIDGANKGLILFSFGTFADMRKMPKDLKNAFANAFASFPEYKFIWKYDLAENETMQFPSNVHTFNWIPQTAILAEPKLKAFISHCGLNSVNEAAKAGKAILCVPLFADQALNTALVVNKGFGSNIDISEVREKGAIVVEDALLRLLNDERYSQAARTVSRKLALTPFSPRERFVKWVEFAAEFPDLNELNMPNEQEMSLFVYYSLDVITMLLIAFLVIFTSLILLIKLTYSYLKKLFNHSNRSKIEKKLK